MKKYIFIVSFCALSGLYAQSQNGIAVYPEIPESHIKHPELAIHGHCSALNEVNYELVHLRTQYSRTFLNKNSTKTTVQSSIPLHHQDENGFWITTSYKLASGSSKVVFPVERPFYEFNKHDLTTILKSEAAQISMGNQTQLVYIGEGGEVIRRVYNSNQEVSLSGDNVMSVPDYFSGVDYRNTLYNDVLKSDFIIKNKGVLPDGIKQLIVEDIVELPNGFSLEIDMIDNQKTNRIHVVNSEGLPVFTFQHPVVTDSKEVDVKTRYAFQPYEAQYSFSKLTENTYKIQIIVDGSWLMSPDRVFPVIIDPVVTVNNTDVINSCFLPNYQQAPLTVNVPAGETVFSSDISYDFVAVNGTNAWIEDQRSFVSGSAGQTPVIAGIGNTDGTYTYSISNSEIANGISNGDIEFVFNFSRNWGGSGCNATFNFVNRREVTVNYGTINFGNGPIYINEYSASNRILNDGFGRLEDWIEIYNASPDEFFNLQGYHLSNDINNPTQWQIQNGMIPPASRVLVYCSKRDISSGTVLHANFNLTQLRPDHIVLADPSGQIIESHEMHVTQTNHSYARTTDGAATWGVCNIATPGQPNANVFSSYATTPLFDVEPGHYSGSVSVSLSSSGADEEIRYTTNGATPTASSTLYTGPITVSSTTVVRARAFSTLASVLPSFIETNTYFIDEDHTLPIFSFSGDADILQLFNGNNSLRPIGHFEYFENNGDFIDENLGDFDKHGNDSWSYAQRGVDFVSRDDHGYKRRLEHPFFATSDRTRFRRLMVKAAANDNYPHANGGAHIRDSYVQTLSQLAGLDLDERSSTNVVLYVNGQYWGVYDLRERVDDNNFTDYYYNQDYIHRDSDDYLQFIKTWGATQAHFGNQPGITAWQNLTQYVQANNMGIAANFDYVESQLNIGSLIDYFVINSFVVARDWLNYNTGWWRGTHPDGQAQKWRYILWDMEGSLGHYINFTGMPDVTATASPCQVENLNVGNGHTQTLRKLIQENPAVRQMYVTRYADLLNTHLSCDRIIEVLDSMINVITPEMPRQISRWGGNITTWENNVQSARDFLTTRCNHLMNTGLADCYNLTGPFATTFNVEPLEAGQIKMNSEWLTSYPFSAQVFGNIETLVKAQAQPGFVFSHWVVDGAVVSPDINNPDIMLQLSQATSITAHFNDLTVGEGDLIYYWHFNNLQTPQDVTTISADYQLITDVSPLMTYIGSGPRDIDANNNGSDLNLHQGELAGKCARVRNPSENRALVFDLPTTGYEDIRFIYAVERTNQGQLKNRVSYSIDGTNFIQTDLVQFEFDVMLEFDIVNIDFTSIQGVNHNPEFKIRIEFEGNNTTSNGNNRFDNIALKGSPIMDLSVPHFEVTNLQVYPNPFNDVVTVLYSGNLLIVDVYDVIGKKVAGTTGMNSNKLTLDLSALTSGVYLLKIHTDSGDLTHRIVRQ